MQVGDWGWFWFRFNMTAAQIRAPNLEPQGLGSMKDETQTLLVSIVRVTSSLYWWQLRNVRKRYILFGTSGFAIGCTVTTRTHVQQRTCINITLMWCDCAGMTCCWSTGVILHRFAVHRWCTMVWHRCDTSIECTFRTSPNVQETHFQPVNSIYQW